MKIDHNNLAYRIRVRPTRADLENDEIGKANDRSFEAWVD